MKPTEASIETAAGNLLREWRTRRRMSQLDLASEAEISQRHLSFLESGRSKPSRDMVLHLAERLDIPLRERNHLLLAAGFAPSYGERPLGDPSLAPAMAAVRLVLKGHEPNPALAVDRHWNLIEANAAIAPFLENIADASLLAPPVNVLRLSLHPAGLAPRIVNLNEWRAHLIARLKRQNDAVGRSRARRTGKRVAFLSGRPANAETVASGLLRHRASAAAEDGNRSPVVHQHDHRVRHGARRDAFGARRRVLLRRR